MKNTNDFNRLKALWKKQARYGNSDKKYTGEDIKSIKMKKSTDFSRSINNSIAFDFVHKSILLVGMLLLIWFYRNDILLIAVLTVLVGCSLYLISRESRIRKELHNLEDYTNELNTVLKAKIQFYSTHFSSLKWMLAFTNGLFVWVGSLYYYYSKYKFYRMEGVEDPLVMVLMVTLALGISYLALTYQFKNNIFDIEEALYELNDREPDHAKINQQLIRKRRQKITMIIVVIIGITLFLLLLMNYIDKVF